VAGRSSVRAYAETVYGVPPEQVVGTMFKINYEMRDGKPALDSCSRSVFRQRQGWQTGGHQHGGIGRRPQVAFGNSDGDQQMLEWATGTAGARLAMIVLHDDAAREFAYGPATGLPDSKVGTFTQALYDEAKRNGWTVISMKRDWKRVFAFEP
jgi:hypothetical protein